MTPPVFSHGSLRLYLLSLLEEAPKHGYELIQALEARFGGTYSPSAGTIYPRLSKLEEEGLVTKTTQGRKTVYEITDAGREELTAREAELRDIEAEVTDSVRRLADEVRQGVNDALKSLRADLASAARESKEHAKPGDFQAGPQNLNVDAQVHSRFALREAELALNEFRQQLRSELRAVAAKGELTDAAVGRLRAELARLRADVLQVIHR
ncbi:PadR family transcriptional regulator [Gryllotalpicola protaetiae]|uniref:PadR family transcriptional regulator n=1 Tax=Gryllotalpicola protaetiae TaxID=2419771 RepID=A0A387BQG0_9MICO|nr:PadR family transcriptional regulator [Gryllotalpicola protaetiae]AYG03216.1 PadR family transcriptional regulator [Gryllotalpicola protaetiae]